MTMIAFIIICHHNCMTTIAQSHVATVPVQIFVRHNFCGRTKSRALFSGIICNQPLCIIIVLKRFNFRG